MRPRPASACELSVRCLREKAILDSDLLKLRDAADKFGKFRVFASGG
jgi:hypothetical protein